MAPFLIVLVNGMYNSEAIPSMSPVHGIKRGSRGGGVESSMCVAYSQDIVHNVGGVACSLVHNVRIQSEHFDTSLEFE